LPLAKTKPLQLAFFARAGQDGAMNDSLSINPSPRFAQKNAKERKQSFESYIIPL
jgi:hypothetical protein